MVVGRSKTTTTATATTTTESSSSRSLSESEKMQTHVNLCEQLEMIGAELKRRGYNANEVPTHYYKHCKRIVNSLEAFSRHAGVRPSMLTAIRFKKGRRIAVIANNTKRAGGGSSKTVKTRRGHNA